MLGRYLPRYREGIRISIPFALAVAARAPILVAAGVAAVAAAIVRAVT